MSPCRPLVVRFGRMGDIVMLLALVDSLHGRLGEPVDVVASGSWTPPLLERQPGVASAYWIRSRKDRYWITPEQWRLVAALRARGPGPTWVCEEKNDKARWLLSRAGFPDSFISDLHDCPLETGEHEVDRLLRFARTTPPAWGDAVPGQDGLTGNSRRVPPLTVAAEWRADAVQWLTRRGLEDRALVLIQAGSRSTERWYRPYRRASNRKLWPSENWARVIDEVSDLELESEILLLGVPAEAALNDDILRRVHTPRVHNVARELPLQRLFALQERAMGMISVDTGPAHSAAALACPLVVLFGVEDPIVYEPRSATGAVVSVSAAAEEGRSILAVRPEEVVAAWTRLTRNTHARLARR